MTEEEFAELIARGREQAALEFKGPRLRTDKHLFAKAIIEDFTAYRGHEVLEQIGYDVTLVSDAHTTVDNKLLTAAQIIAHHNALLDGFDAGPHAIKVRAAGEIKI